jgi:hypothetical protein
MAYVSKYRDLKKITIKNKFHIHVVDELLDEYQGEFILLS